jgi:hypothetical protein
MLFAASAIAVALRWYSRLWILKRTGYEDYLVTASLVSVCLDAASLDGQPLSKALI